MTANQSSHQGKEAPASDPRLACPSHPSRVRAQPEGQGPLSATSHTKLPGLAYLVTIPHLVSASPTHPLRCTAPPAPRHSSLVPPGWPSHESPALLTKPQPLPTTASQTRARQLAQTSPRQRAPARPLLLIPQHVTAVFCGPSSVRSLPHTQRPESCPAHKNRSANIC